MAVFTFDAPALGDAASCAGRKRLMGWLRDRLAVRGVIAIGPLADAAGWRLAINAEDGLVTILLAPDEGAVFRVIVEALGQADAEYEDTIAAFEDLRDAHPAPSPEFGLTA